MDDEKRGQVVVITGASAGVGRATAQAFARRGARIGLIARGIDGLEGAKRDVEALGGEALVLPCDVADADGIERAAGQVEELFGPIDLWINNAMASVFSPVKEMSAAEFRRVTEVTYLGFVYGTLSALRRMLPRDRGVIVQVGSALAYRGIPLQAAYCGAKHAIQGFTESLRCELLHDKANVRITMVQMPALNTPQFRWVKSRLPNKAQPVPPIFQPEVAADAIVFAADNDRREVWVGWPTVKAIGGNKIVPGYADHYLAKQGYSAQQTSEPRDPDHPHNLWDPVPGDHGAHGVFDDRSRDSSIQLWATKHRRMLGIAGVAAAGATLAASLLGGGRDGEDGNSEQGYDDDEEVGREIRRLELRTRW
ncbi:MAG TPA: SDR family oxidoreductase [Longimicrobiaceae bacterium]|nr:SDR family oxidoreductase [Longimicrobiaceae bacterium]